MSELIDNANNEKLINLFQQRALDAQRQLNMMRDRQVAAKLQTAQVTVSLYKALGGDWIVEPQ